MANRHVSAVSGSTNGHYLAVSRLTVDSFFECSHLMLAQWLIIFFLWTTNIPGQLMAD